MLQYEKSLMNYNDRMKKVSNQDSFQIYLWKNELTLKLNEEISFVGLRGYK